MLGIEVEYTMERLTADNAKFIGGFNCGSDAIDLSEYLTEHALDDNECVTYIFRTNTNKVIAYASLSCTAIVENLPGNSTLNKYIPSVLIDKFAVDEEYHGLQYEDGNEELTLSEVIFFRVLDEIYRISKEIIGAKYIVLYSTNRAYHFYIKCGMGTFENEMLVPNDPYIDECTPLCIGPI